MPGGGRWVKGIPHHGDAKLELTKAAGGSNGSMFANGPDGKRWLVKDYGGNADRVATELVSNAIYREMGARVPTAGISPDPRTGRPRLAYPTLDGKHSYKGPSRRVGQHFMTDALVGNRDVLGLENDNILWDEHGPIRLDQGGTLEFRAMGSRKDFGPVPLEVHSLMASPTRQGSRSSKVTHEEMRAQARQIAQTLTPKRIDELVSAAPWKDAQMRARVAKNLKARVAWMGRFADGGVTVGQLAEAAGPGALLGWLEEGVSLQHLWDEAKHPRNQHGEFVKKIGDLKVGDSVKLDAKTTVKRDADGSIRVVRSGGIIKGFTHPADAARAALDRSAKSKDADSVGGATSHKDYNAYLHHRVAQGAMGGGDGAHVDKGPLGKSANTIAFGGDIHAAPEAKAELEALNGRLADLKAAAAHDKYKARAVPTLEARHKELSAKLKTLGGTPAEGEGGVKVGTILHNGTNYYKVLGSDTSGEKWQLMRLHDDGTPADSVYKPEVPKADLGALKAVEPPWKGAEGGPSPQQKAILEKFPPGTKLQWSGAGPPYTVLGPTPTSADSIDIKDGGTGKVFSHPVHAFGPAKVVGDVPAKQGTSSAVEQALAKHPPGTNILVKKANAAPGAVAPGKIVVGPGPDGTIEVKGGPGTTGVSTFWTPEKVLAAHAKEGVKPVKPAAPAKPGKKVSGKQANALGAGGAPAPLKDLHIEAGDKIQYKKGGWTYEVIEPSTPTGHIRVQGPNGKLKHYSGHVAPAFVQKADKSPLKLKEPAAPAAPSPTAAPASPEGFIAHPGAGYVPKVGDKLIHAANKGSAANAYEVKSVNANGYVGIQNQNMSSPSPVSIETTQNPKVYTHVKLASTAAAPALKPGDTVLPSSEIPPGTVLHSNAGNPWKVVSGSPTNASIESTATGVKHTGMNVVSYKVQSLGAPQKTHAEQVALVKNGLAQLGTNNTELGKLGGEVVFQTPSGKLMYKKAGAPVSPAGIPATVIETGATVNVTPSAVPPKLSNFGAHVTAAKAAIAMKAEPPTPPTPPEPPKADDGWGTLPTGGAAESKIVAAQQHTQLPSGSHQALSFYTGSGYQPINTQLRTPRHLGASSTEKQIAAMDKAMETAPALPEDMVVWRGVTGKTAEAYKQAQKGQVIRDNGFISTSVSESTAKDWGNGLVIKQRLPKGTRAVYVGPGMDISSHSSERELILKRGIAFEVLETRMEGGHKVLIVEPISGHK